MHTYFVEFNDTTGARIKRELPQNELEEMVSHGLSELKRMKEHNELAKKSLEQNGIKSRAVFTYMYDGLVAAAKKGWMTSLQTVCVCDYAQEINPDINAVVDLTIKQTDEFVEHQTILLKNLQQGNVKSATFITTTEPKFSSAKILDGVVCRDCGHVVHKTMYSQHLNSFRCLVDSGTKDIRDQGYIELDDSAHILAVRSSGVKSELRPATYSMWVPPWVADALNAYGQNKGWGGLKLAEYLRKVGPEQK